MDYTYYLLPLISLLKLTKENNVLKINNKEVSRLNIFGIVERINDNEGYKSLVVNDGTGEIYVYFQNNLELKAGDAVEILGELVYDENPILHARIIKKIDLIQFMYNSIKSLFYYNKYWNNKK
ncbi:MAG: hypothetical protein QXX36_01870 [Candidatus Rehaiarchaeum fermentans]|nr:hypothetical protein [Candidatus Rehaiarchaeum fermentans]MCW1297322.1 hypothetical protein [Candidatus Rehaiarchaeum fermentans]MCW1302353.1 hypothetical protein [Candidatus Rehaiarchaeum fermentans]